MIEVLLSLSLSPPSLPPSPLLLQTVEAAKEARTLLEFTRDVVHVPRDLAGTSSAVT